MSFQQDLWLTIESFTGHKNVITLNVVYVDFVDDLETGLFFSQLIYWSDKGSRRDGFIFKTEKEWHEELRLSRYAIRKARKKLEGMGILETKVKKANGNPTVHYKLNKEAFTEQFTSFLRNRTNENTISDEGNYENEHSLTETTTEIKTETTKRYTIQQNGGELLSYYGTKYAEYFGRQHPTVTKAQLQEVQDILNITMMHHGFDKHEVMCMMDIHFKTLPPRNDEKIFGFVGQNERVTPMIRYGQDLDEYNEIMMG